jgi:hypothetical protein
VFASGKTGVAMAGYRASVSGTSGWRSSVFAFGAFLVEPARDLLLEAERVLFRRGEWPFEVDRRRRDFLDPLPLGFFFLGGGVEASEVPDVVGPSDREVASDVVASGEVASEVTLLLTDFFLRFLLALGLTTAAVAGVGSIGISSATGAGISFLHAQQQQA